MKDSNILDLIVIGGGAAGYFGALRYQSLNPEHRVLILEKGKRTLQKVKISGGGRCNVTHGKFIPKELIHNYPRGEKELLGPFHHFAPGDMMGWLEERGVPLKIEDDGRVFPVSDDSQSIIDAFENERQSLNIALYHEGVQSIKPSENGWMVNTINQKLQAKSLLVATGSSKAFWQHLESIGVKMVPPVPSLFTFNITHPVIKGLQGISFPYAEVTIPKLKLSESGPLLITHWGLSGPAVLKLSAVGARKLHGLDYEVNIEVSWTGSTFNNTQKELKEWRKQQAASNIKMHPFEELTKRFWQRITEQAGISGNWGDVSNKKLDLLSSLLSRCVFEVKGKSTFKDEFVTAGGVSKKDIDFRTMEHKQFKGLYFAGEVIDIDAVTGGFNFQSAWTTSWIAAESINKSPD
ncbi:MAG: aminoacetone oxidase family FAD-binding enzyme [Flavobacteriales bacterium]|nr:aminoacetone oxidase family FAD-binding enzyme [Flavobacteriales bacterium]